MTLCTCGLFSSHFTLSAISYTLPCGCKQGAKVFVMKAYFSVYISVMSRYL